MIQNPYGSSGDLSVWNLGSYNDTPHSLLAHPDLNYRALAVFSSGFALMQVYPAKYCYLKLYAGFPLDMYQAVMNPLNPSSVYVISAFNTVQVSFGKLTFGSDDRELSIDYHFVVADTSAFDSTPGGTVDVFYSENTQKTESWFACTS